LEILGVNGQKNGIIDLTIEEEFKWGLDNLKPGMCRNLSTGEEFHISKAKPAKNIY
jgi:hypothetical protein